MRIEEMGGDLFKSQGFQRVDLHKEFAGEKIENNQNFNPVVKFFKDVNTTNIRAENSNVDFSLGNAESIHRVIINMEEAMMATKLMVQIRNRAVEAYKEIMRMQI